MKQNYSQKLEMQTANKTLYKPSQFISSNEGKFLKFLKDNFEFPSKNIKEISLFINEDNELVKIIYNLQGIISSELPYNQITLDFMKETDPHEKILEIIIYSKLNDEKLLLKEDTITDRLINSYPKTSHEYILLVDHYDKQ